MALALLVVADHVLDQSIGLHTLLTNSHQELDCMEKNVGGSIMMAKLQGQDWKEITSTLKCIGAPTDAAGINLDRDILVDALVEAQQMRPERYTVLNEAGMSHEKALKLAKETNVL